MERSEWLKVVYEAACRVAEMHGPGLRAAVESTDDDGQLHQETDRVASETIAARDDIWPFIKYSRHPEPAADDWRRASTFEGALVRAAVSALSADIGDILEGLSTGRLPTAEQMRPADPAPGNGG